MDMLTFDGTGAYFTYNRRKTEDSRRLFPSQGLVFEYIYIAV